MSKAPQTTNKPEKANTEKPELLAMEVMGKAYQLIGEGPCKTSAIDGAVKQIQQNNQQLSKVNSKTLTQVLSTVNEKLLEVQFLHSMAESVIDPQGGPVEQKKSQSETMWQKFKKFLPERFSKPTKPQKGRKESRESLSGPELVKESKVIYGAMREFYGYSKDKGFPETQIVNLSKIRETEEKSPTITPKESGSPFDFISEKLRSLRGSQKEVKEEKEEKEEKQSKQRKQEALLKSAKKDKQKQSLSSTAIANINYLAKLDIFEILDSLSPSSYGNLTSILSDIQKLGNGEKIKKINKKYCELRAYFTNSSHFQSPKTQVDNEVKWIVLFYKSLSAQQLPLTFKEQRKSLKQFCDHQLISKNMENPFAVVKVLQKRNLTQNSILKRLRELPISLKESSKISIDHENHEWHIQLEHEFKRIHEEVLFAKSQKQYMIRLQRLTNSKTRTVTFLFSGFLSKDSCKVEQWNGIVNSCYDTQMYAVRWQSKTVLDFTKYLLIEGLGVGISLFTKNPLMAAAKLPQMLKLNPYYSASDEAVQTGESIAEFLIANFKGYYINLVGFSLGTEVILHVLKRLAYKKSLVIVNKVYLMGGAADKHEVERVLKYSPCPLTVTNLYSLNDWVLKYLLKVSEWNKSPVGLEKLGVVEGHEVTNVDCTEFVDGHTTFRNSLQFYSRFLGMADD